MNGAARWWARNDCEKIKVVACLLLIYMSSSKKVVVTNTAALGKMTKAQLKAVTNKKQRQEMKQQKKEGNKKSIEERAAEVFDVQKQLESHGLSDQMPPIKRLYDVLKRFVVTGETACGMIEFAECPPQPYGRNIVYKFTNIKGTKGTCDLMVRNGQDYFTKEARRNLPVTQPPEAAQAPPPDELGAFQSALETAMATGELFGPDADPNMAQVVERLLEQAKRNPGSDEIVTVGNTSVAVLPQAEQVLSSPQTQRVEVVE